MAKTKVFVSFDYDKDRNYKFLLNARDKNNKFVLAENLEFIQHQILQNWFRLHLVYANQKNTVIFENIPTNSSLYWEGNNYTNLYYRYESIKTTSGKIGIVSFSNSSSLLKSYE